MTKPNVWMVCVLALGLWACDDEGEDRGASVFDEVNREDSSTDNLPTTTAPDPSATMAMNLDEADGEQEVVDNGSVPDDLTAQTGGGAGTGGSDGQDASDFIPTVSDEAQACDDFQLILKPRPTAVAKVILMVDRSPSMNIDQDLWTPMKAAVSEVTTSFQGLVDFGLMLFPNPTAFMECAVGEVDLEPQGGSADEINRIVELYAPDRSFGGTPTAESLRAAGDALVAMNPNAQNNYILLATDGGPGCNAAALSCDNCEWLTGYCHNDANCLDDRRTIDRVLELSLEGIDTFVISIPGAERFSEVLDRMAVAGNTAVDGRHYQVEDIAQLGSALRATTGSLVPCEYDVQAAVDDVGSIVVTIDGDAVPRDLNRMNGWDFFGSELHFYGDACALLRDGGSHGIRASYDCE